MLKERLPKGDHCLCVFACVHRLTGQVADEAVTDVSEILHLESSHPNMSFTCRFQRAVLTVMSRIFLIALGELSHHVVDLMFLPSHKPGVAPLPAAAPLLLLGLDSRPWETASKASSPLKQSISFVITAEPPHNISHQKDPRKEFHGPT